MKELLVFDPPMCCSTGICGPAVDPKLARFAANLHWLASEGVHVERYNLAQQPEAFAGNAAVRGALAERGTRALPLLLVDGRIVSEGSYPEREELASLLSVAGAQVAST